MIDLREKFEAWYLLRPHCNETGLNMMAKSESGLLTLYSDGITQVMFEAYHQGVKDMQAENERLVAWLKRIQKSAGGREDDINDMDSKLCDIWLAADEALALEPYKD